jgi:hypothetical protein
MNPIDKRAYHLDTAPQQITKLLESWIEGNSNDGFPANSTFR